MNRMISYQMLSDVEFWTPNRPSTIMSWKSEHSLVTQSKILAEAQGVKLNSDYFFDFHREFS